jgi:hypothetical protein
LSCHLHALTNSHNCNAHLAPNWSRDEDDKTKQEKTRQGITKQDKTRQDKTKQNKTKQAKPRQDKTRQNMAKRDKARQDKTKAPTFLELLCPLWCLSRLLRAQHCLL